MSGSSPERSLPLPIGNGFARNLLSPTGSLGARSPPEKKSPLCGRGRTMKDIEEELLELRRENFDLKMRIYIMEEQQEKLFAEKDPEELQKANALLKSQVFAMKKDLAEKEDLILEAAKAMDALSIRSKEETEDIHETILKEQEQNRATIAQLQEELRISEEKLKEQGMSKFDDTTLLYSMAFGLNQQNTNNPQQILEQITSLEIQVEKLESELRNEIEKRNLADNMVTNLQSELASLQEVHNTTQEELAMHIEKLCCAKNDIDDKNTAIKTLQDQLSALEESTKEKESCSWVLKENKLASEIQKRLIEQEKLLVIKLQGKLENTKVENAQLQDQIIELRRRLDDLEMRNTSDGHSNRIEIFKKEKEALFNQIKSTKTMLPCNITLRKSEFRSSDPEAKTSSQSSQGFNNKENAELEQLRSDYNLALKTIQDYMAHNKLLSRDLNIFKTKFGDIKRIKESERIRVKCAGGDAPASEDYSTEHYKVRVQELIEELAEVTKERDNLSLEMEKQAQSLLEKVKEKELQLKTIEQQIENNHSVSDGYITELEEELKRLRQELEVKSQINPENCENIRLIEELGSKKKEIEHLNEELRKRTINLQELVNTELWDKNREIEKLNKACERKQVEVLALKKQLTIKESELKKFEKMPGLNSDQICEGSAKVNDGLLSQIEELKEKVKGDEALIISLKEECDKWKKESELSEKSRKELINACTLLTTRLEELATFLDSLLPALGEKKRQLLLEAIERSREVSRSFSFSLMDSSNVPILPDFSQVDFFSGEDSTTLESKVEDGDGKDDDEVVRLRTQVESLVEKLRNKDNNSPEKKASPRRLFESIKGNEGGDFASLISMTNGVFNLDDVTEGSLIETFGSSDSAKPTTDDQGEAKSQSQTVCKSPKPELKKSNSGCAGGHSESEGWSEPDKSVSLARIGIREESLLRKSSSDESSSSCKKSNSVPSSGKKGRHDINEIRRLNSKIKTLEEINSALRTELRSLCQGSPLLKVDKAVTCQFYGDSDVQKFMLSKIRNPNGKIKASLSDNQLFYNRLDESFHLKFGEGKGDGIIVEHSRKLSDQLGQTCNLCQEMQVKCVRLENECHSLGKQLTDEEARNKTLNDQVILLKMKSEETLKLSQEVSELRASLKEKENEVLEKQCIILELRNERLVLQGGLEEAKVKLNFVEANSRISETALQEARERWKEADSERQVLKEKYEQEMLRLRSRLNQLKADLEKLGREHKEELTNANRRIEELTMLKEMVEEEWKLKWDAFEKEKKEEMEVETGRRMEAERKLVRSYEVQAELRNRLESEMARSREAEVGRKLEEKAWRRRLSETERSKQERESALRRKLDEAALATSEAVLERTRLANDKLRLQHDLRRKDDYTNQVKSELEHRVAELEAANSELETKLETLKVHPLISDAEIHSPVRSPTRPFSLLLSPSFKRQRSNPSSDYMSDQEPQVGNTNTNFWFPVCGRSNNNSSPDLGIESDQGRVSSLDPLPLSSNNGDLNKLEVENEELKGQLKKTREALEETLNQLTSANQKKKQVERAISRQLHKTHHILQKARVNLESHD